MLLKVQCSSLIKWPLRTMSWRVLAFSRPTLREDKIIHLSLRKQHNNLDQISKCKALLGGAVFDVVQQTL